MPSIEGCCHREVDCTALAGMDRPQGCARTALACCCVSADINSRQASRRRAGASRGKMCTRTRSASVDRSTSLRSKRLGAADAPDAGPAPSPRLRVRLCWPGTAASGPSAETYFGLAPATGALASGSTVNFRLKAVNRQRDSATRCHTGDTWLHALTFANWREPSTTSELMGSKSAPDVPEQYRA